jgi:hypothetical protein
MEEQEEATEELIENLTESQTFQMEILIKSTTEAMKKMILLVNLENKPPTNNNGMSKRERKKIRDEKCNIYHNAPIRKYCNTKHPAKIEEECWELEANAASRPSN